MHSCFEGVPWPRHLECLLDLALAVPLGIVRVCLEHSERDHQTQSYAWSIQNATIRRNHMPGAFRTRPSDAIRRNQTQSDAIKIAWIILKAAEDLSTGTRVAPSDAYLMREAIRRHQSEERRNQTSSE